MDTLPIPDNVDVGASDAALRRMLENRQRQKRLELEVLERRVIDTVAQRDQARQHFEHLRMLLADLGSPQVHPAVPSASLDYSATTTSQNAAVPRDQPAPGNRSPNIPPRQLDFEQISLPKAALMLLSDAHGRAVHVDEMVKRVYVVKTAEELDRAKKNLVSTLSRGVQQGLWEKAGLSMYRARVTPIQPEYELPGTDASRPEEPTEGGAG